MTTVDRWTVKSEQQCPPIWRRNYADLFLLMSENGLALDFVLLYQRKQTKREKTACRKGSQLDKIMWNNTVTEGDHIGMRSKRGVGTDLRANLAGL